MDKFINNLYYVLFAIVLVLALLMHFKPNIVFKPNGRPREWGFGEDAEHDKRSLYDIKTIVLLTVVAVMVINDKQ